MFSLIAHVARRLRATFEKSASRSATTRRRNRYRSKSWVAAEVLEDRTLLDGVAAGGAPQVIFSPAASTGVTQQVNAVVFGQITEAAGMETVAGSGTLNNFGQWSVLDQNLAAVFHSSQIPGNVLNVAILDIAIADFDGDGDEDVATASQYSENDETGTILVWWRNIADQNGGIPAFQQQGLENYDGSAHMRIDAGDVDGDGDIDLVALNVGWTEFGEGSWGFGSLVTLWSNDQSSNGFSGTVLQAFDRTPGDIAILDFQGDGRRDIAFSLTEAGEYTESNVFLLSGQDDGEGGTEFVAGSAQEILEDDVGGTIPALAVGELNGAPGDELVGGRIDDSGNGRTYYLEHNSEGFPLVFEIGGFANGYPPVTAVGVADVNGDGALDVAAAYSSLNWGENCVPYGRIVVYQNDPLAPGEFSESTAAITQSLITSLAFADINGDNRADLVIGEDLNGLGQVSSFLSDDDQPPEGTDNAIVVPEDGRHVFSVSDFGFTDPGESPDDGFLAATIATLPQPGRLSLQDQDVCEGQIISAADIAAGKLVYAPAANTNGDGYARFTFQVQDDGGTANGAVDLDPTPNTITIDVTPGIDFGDAPESYGTASHTSVGPRLGATRDSEPAALISSNAQGDDQTQIDDEHDSVAFLSALAARDNVATTRTISVYAPDGGMLDAWIDFDAPCTEGAGIFDPDEHLFGGTSLDLSRLETTNGVYLIDIVVPEGSYVGTTFARFRISSTGGLDPTGFAPDGEVEDYLVQIVDGDELSDDFENALGDAVERFQNLANQLPQILPGDPFVASGDNVGGGGAFNAVPWRQQEALHELVRSVNEQVRLLIPDQNAAANVWGLVIDPVDFVLTDPIGRTFGSVGGVVTNTIGSATYSGDGAVELLVIQNALPGTYTVEFVGIGGSFRGGASLLTASGDQQVSAFQGFLGTGTRVALALDYSIPQVADGALLFGGEVAEADAASINQAFLNVPDDGDPETETALDALAQLAGLDAENLSTQDTLRREWDRMVKVTSIHATAPRRLILDALTPDWLATWPEAFDELSPTSESAELVEEFWKGLGQSLMGGIPGRVFHLSEIMGVEIPHLFLPNDAAPGETAPEYVSDRGTDEIGTEGKSVRSPAARSHVTESAPIDVSAPLALARNDRSLSAQTESGRDEAQAATEGNLSRTAPAPLSSGRRNAALPLESHRSIVR